MRRQKKPMRSLVLYGVALILCTLIQLSISNDQHIVDHGVVVTYSRAPAMLAKAKLRHTHLLQHHTDAVAKAQVRLDSVTALLSNAEKTLSDLSSDLQSITGSCETSIKKLIEKVKDYGTVMINYYACTNNRTVLEAENQNLSQDLALRVKSLTDTLQQEDEVKDKLFAERLSCTKERSKLIVFENNLKKLQAQNQECTKKLKERTKTNELRKVEIKSLESSLSLTQTKSMDATKKLAVCSGKDTDIAAQAEKEKQCNTDLQKQVGEKAALMAEYNRLQQSLQQLSRNILAVETLYVSDFTKKSSEWTWTGKSKAFQWADSNGAKLAFWKELGDTKGLFLVNKINIPASARVLVTYSCKNDKGGLRLGFSCSQSEHAKWFAGPLALSKSDSTTEGMVNSMWLRLTFDRQWREASALIPNNSLCGPVGNKYLHVVLNDVAGAGREPQLCYVKSVIVQSVPQTY